ncbi:ArnT family glycosyltransferase [Planctomycetota bacterium]
MTKLTYGVIAAAAAFLLFFNLGDRYLWMDEACTATLAVNITEFGVPKAVDGKNHITVFGAEVDENEDNVWTWSPWLGEYLAALSFLAFGVSTTAARLPFAVFALLTVVLLAYTAYRVFEDHRVAIVAMALCVGCALFLLHGRQCRYYAVALFAQTGLVCGFHNLLRGRRTRGVLQFTSCLVIQFYVNYIFVPGNIAAALLTGALVSRRYRGLFTHLCVSAAALAVVALPWIAYARPWRANPVLARFIPLENLVYYAIETHYHIIPLVIFLLPLLVRAGRLVRTGRGVGTSGDKEPRTVPAIQKSVTLYLWITISTQLLILSLVLVGATRYQVVLVPLFLLLGADVVVRSVRSAALRYVLVIVLVTSNAVSVAAPIPARWFFPNAPPHHLESPLLLFLRDITSEYTGRTQQVVQFLRSSGTPDQSVLVLDTEFPLIFHTGMRVIDARLRVPGAPVTADWILPQPASAINWQPPLQLAPNLAQSYDRMVIEINKTAYGENMPEPHKHQYFTNPEREEFVLYRRRVENNAPPR